MAKKPELKEYVSRIAEHTGDATLIRKTAEFLSDAKAQEQRIGEASDHLRQFRREILAQSGSVTRELLLLHRQLKGYESKLWGQTEWEISQSRISDYRSEARVAEMNRLLSKVHLDPMEIATTPGLLEDFLRAVYRVQREPLRIMRRNIRAQIGDYWWRSSRRFAWHYAIDLFWGLLIFTLAFGAATGRLEFWYKGAIVATVWYFVVTFWLQPIIDSKLREMDLQSLKRANLDLLSLRVIRECTRSLADYITRETSPPKGALKSVRQ